MTEIASKRSVSHHVQNVIIVDDTADNYGGTAQVAYVTARVLADRGYNVVYFAGTDVELHVLKGLGTTKSLGNAGAL